ncbi:MAG: hypothetical protein QM722_22450 [Piscinibacter sp.]
MRVWLRLLTVWFIAIALPVQGIAGVTMAHCGASHERMATAVDAAGPLHDEHHDTAAHHHDADLGHDAGMHDHAEATPAKAKSAGSSDLGQYKCSSCAACCAGAALPAATPRLPQAPGAATLFADAVVTVDAFTSDGPERPPRIHLV